MEDLDVSGGLAAHHDGLGRSSGRSMVKRAAIAMGALAAAGATAAVDPVSALASAPED